IEPPALRIPAERRPFLSSPEEAEREPGEEAGREGREAIQHQAPGSAPRRDPAAQRARREDFDPVELAPGGDREAIGEGAAGIDPDLPGSRSRSARAHRALDRWPGCPPGCQAIVTRYAWSSPGCVVRSKSG